MVANIETEALVIDQIGAPFVLHKVHLDELQPNEVLVRIVASGLCHTDLSIQSGQLPSTYPCIVGHEGSGIVQSIGSSITRVQEGDHVLLSFASCENCSFCKIGKPAGCCEFVERNFGRVRNEQVGDRATTTVYEEGAAPREVKGTFFGQSSFSRMAVVCESSIVKVHKSTDLIQMAPLGCGAQTGAGTILNVLRPAPSSTLVIFGLGAVGAGALFSAAYLKVSTIIVVDLHSSRLDFALTAGATHVINGKDKDVINQIRKITGGLGADYGIEATGNATVLGSCFESVRNYGTVVCVGDPGPGVKPPFDVHDLIISQKKVMGATEGDCNPQEFIPFLIELFENGQFPIDKISKTFPVEDFDLAVKAMKSGECIKPIILF